MSRVRSLLAAFAFVAMCPSLAYAGHTLPIYPHSDRGGNTREEVTAKYVNQAVSQGETTGLITSDSVAKVDAWYGGNLPKSCTHTSFGRYGSQYTCGDRRVTIALQDGRTSIVLGPNM